MARRTKTEREAEPTIEGFTLAPPIEPMLAKVESEIPEGGYLYEPKWDGFRAIVFKEGERLFIQSRDLRPLDRYFPELAETFRAHLPERVVLDGEIVLRFGGRLDFERLQLRLHPAASRVKKLAEETPVSFVAFDVLAEEGRDVREEPFAKRRNILERVLSGSQGSISITPITGDVAQARVWFERFEGAGLDGVIAKPKDMTYQPGKRAMIKIKHVRTADCVVIGFRWHKEGPGLVGSLLLGLYDEEGRLHHVGITSSFTREKRKELAEMLTPRVVAEPSWGKEWSSEGVRRPAGSRWSAGKDLSFQALEPSLVCEVKYDHLEGTRFRHATTFIRFREDKAARDCDYAQLEAALRSPDLTQIWSG